ncbi:TPA: hypothetical protein ACGSTL_001430 [Vibrio parahaemolyticus]|jgi:hypothetical protein|uniref:hypothetical protein n=1 Tax=Vibrio campbellii TaxID=680 RepID=UPI001F0779E8|nr:hypothetical protein [Vibrio campbellii]UMM06875.1 hypothetical protein MKR81_26810 [Vibrio campbellii]
MMQPVEVKLLDFDFELNHHGLQNANFKITRISIGSHDFVIMHDEDSRGPSIIDYVDYFIPEIVNRYELNYETTTFYRHLGKVGAHDAKFYQVIFDCTRVKLSSSLPCLYEVAWKSVEEEQRAWMARQVFHASLH